MRTKDEIEFEEGFKMFEEYQTGKALASEPAVETAATDKYEPKKIGEAMKTALIATGLVALAGFLTGVGNALKDYCLKN